MNAQVFHLSIAFVAALIAGMMNSVAGGGTLVSFPALVWLGRDPIIANATNAVALWPGSLAGMIGFRRELQGTRKWMLMLLAPSIIGGLAGAILLLLTPSPIFASIVPFLILFATVLFAAGDAISRKLGSPSGEESDPTRGWWSGAVVFQFFVAVYGGYFGAGMGILMLAALKLLGLADIHRMNGLKNLFAFSINGVASVYFIWSGKINWADAVVMAVGAVIGGYGGAWIARKLGREFVRRTVIFIGFAMAVSLLVKRLLA